MKSFYQMATIAAALYLATATAPAATGGPYNTVNPDMGGMWFENSFDAAWMSSSVFQFDTWGREPPSEPPQWLPPVEIRGKRRNSELITVINNGAAPINYGRDSGDSGYEFPDKELTPPTQKDRAACIKGCGDTQASENALCASRATEMAEVVDVAAGTVVIYNKWGKYIPGQPPILRKGMKDLTPGGVWTTGSAATGAWLAACTGFAAKRYLNCTTNTCKQG